MKFTYDDETKNHRVIGKGTMILSKNEYGIKVDNIENFEFRELTIVGQWGKFGRLKQLINAFRFIYGIGEYKEK